MCRGVRVRSCLYAVGAQVILASADSPLKAGMLRILKARIDSDGIVHYSSVYDAVMRWHRGSRRMPRSRQQGRWDPRAR